MQLKVKKIFLNKKKKLKQLKIEYLEINNLSEHEKQEENCQKPVRVSNFWSNNYIEYKNNDNGNKTLSVEESLKKIRPYLKSIINNLKKSDT